MQDPDFQQWASERGLNAGNASETYSKWLDGFNITPEQAAYLTGFVLKETSYYMDKCYLHGVWLFDESTIRTCPDATKALQDHLVLIGNCPNGDYLAIDLLASPVEIGFVSHDRLWRPAPPPIRECFLNLGVNFAGFLKLEKQGEMISDFYDAETYLRKQP